MNYKKIYSDLIKSRLKNPPKENFEKHHILPKSLFPEKAKDKNNLVKLDYRAHYVAHHLLYRYYKSIWNEEAACKMAYALFKMCKNTNGLHVSINQYEKAKINMLPYLKHNGSKNGMYGKKHTIQAKNKMSKNYVYHKTNGFYGHKHSQQMKKEWSLKRSGENNSFYGKKHSDQTKKKISLKNSGKNSSLYGKICVNNGIINKYVYQDQIPEGFEKGKIKKNK